MAGIVFDALRAIRVFDDKFAAVVFVWFGEEKRGGKIGADAVRRTGNLADGAVHVRAELLTTRITIEHWRQNVQGQRRGHEQRIQRERFQNHLADLTGGGMRDWNLQVIFGPGCLRSSGRLAIDPFGRLQNFSGFGSLSGRENVWNREQHGNGRD